ncbi:MAG: Fe-S cluster assembly protein SufD [Alphaproteobacteria bacterium]|nr:Fe-S cluster assembly protein SufD [Alphaproteobacteria bacterium]
MSARTTDALAEAIASEAKRARPSAWAEARRAKALAAFQAGGVPHRRVEDWKYSDLRSALSSPAAVVETAPAPAPFADIAGLRLEIRDGVLRSDLAKLPPTLEACDLSQLDAAPDWVRAQFGAQDAKEMAAASLALMAGGVALRVKSGVAVEEPLQLNFTSSSAHHARVLVVLEDGASLTLLESHDNAAPLANLGVEIVLGEKAQLTHLRLAHSAETAVQVEEVAVSVAAGGAYRLHAADFGAKLSRLEVAIALTGETAEAQLSGVAVTADTRHADVTTRIDHAVGNTHSTQLFKYAAGGHSRTVYQGRITVAEGADGTDSRQTAKALLLSPRAEADLKPELIIFADDVKCAHGAAVGDLDAEALFYLRARGIPEAEARGLLIRAFLEDAVSEIENEALRGAMWGAVEAALLSASEAGS